MFTISNAFVAWASAVAIAVALAVALAVEMEKKQGAGLTAACACLFCAIAAYFLWRSFYGMRIRKSLAD